MFFLQVMTNIPTAEWLSLLSGKLIDHGHGLLDVSLASYNHLIKIDLPRMINEMRPIVWSERGSNGSILSVTIQMKFASTQKPMLTESQPQILLPLQAQQLGRSYNGRILVRVYFSGPTFLVLAEISLDRGTRPLRIYPDPGECRDKHTSISLVTITRGCLAP